MNASNYVYAEQREKFLQTLFKEIERTSNIELRQVKEHNYKDALSQHQEMLLIEKKLHDRSDEELLMGYVKLLSEFGFSN